MERLLTEDERIRKAELVAERRRNFDYEYRNCNLGMNEESFFGRFVKKFMIQLLAALLVYSGIYYYSNLSDKNRELIIDKVSFLVQSEYDFDGLYSKLANNFLIFDCIGVFNNFTNNSYVDNTNIDGSDNTNIDGSDNTNIDGSDNTNIEESNYTNIQKIDNINIEKSDNTIFNFNGRILSLNYRKSCVGVGGGELEDSIALEFDSQENVFNDDKCKQDVDNNQQNNGVGSFVYVAENNDCNNSLSYVKPLKSYIITSKFGSRTPTKIVSANHKGIDLGAITGESIFSSTDGIVSEVSSVGDLGKHIVIKNGDVEIIYAHCSELFVKVGDCIKQGDVIALVGATGNATGPHLHFEIRVNKNAIDPETVIEF